jgi:hypothetical protein
LNLAVNAAISLPLPEHSGSPVQGFTLKTTAWVVLFTTLFEIFRSLIFEA